MEKQYATFTKFTDIKSRPDFSLTSVMTPESISSLIGTYAFPITDPKERCQVLEKITRCNQPNRNGWVGKNIHGQEGLIGICCGRHFKADEKFLLERNRLRNELSVREHIAKLESLRDDAKFAETLRNASDDYMKFRSVLNKAASFILASTQNSLNNLAKSGRNEVVVMFENVVIDEERRRKVTWLATRIGHLQGLSIWQASKSGAIRVALSEVEEAYKIKIFTSDLGKRRLSNLVKALSRLPECVASLGELKAASDAFMEESNLKLLCFVPDSTVERKAIAKLILDGKFRASDIEREAESFLQQIDRNLRSEYGGRDFRI